MAAEESVDHVAMRARDDARLAEELRRRGSGPLGEALVVLDLELQRRGERLDGFDAARVRARHDPQNAKRDELVHELSSLPPTAFVERPEVIFIVPVKTVSCRRMPQEDAHSAFLKLFHARGH